jgi:two-component system, chemotaxis family, chemotaxis protein CheY
LRTWSNIRIAAVADKRTKLQDAEGKGHPAAGAVPGQRTVYRRMFAREVPALDLSDISLFVINDNEFVRTYMERLLGIMRVGRVVSCADPVRAREELAAASPDIVMIDLDLSGDEGIELARAIRCGEAGIRKDAAILVASAFVDRDYVMRARESGVNWTLVKPLSFKRLYEGLVRVILDERPFVETGGFAGPDRRLLVGIAGYDGFDRRKGGKS